MGSISGPVFVQQLWVGRVLDKLAFSLEGGGGGGGERRHIIEKAVSREKGEEKKGGRERSRGKEAERKSE
jgi:hypothetical protein